MRTLSSNTWEFEQIHAFCSTLDKICAKSIKVIKTFDVLAPKTHNCK